MSTNPNDPNYSPTKAYIKSVEDFDARYGKRVTMTRKELTIRPATEPSEIVAAAHRELAEDKAAVLLANRLRNTAAACDAYVGYGTKPKTPLTHQDLAKLLREAADMLNALTETK